MAPSQAATETAPDLTVSLRVTALTRITITRLFGVKGTISLPLLRTSSLSTLRVELVSAQPARAQHSRSLEISMSERRAAADRSHSSGMTAYSWPLLSHQRITRNCPLVAGAVEA